MNTTQPSYETQKEKIIQAYFKDEIRIYEASFCFCGTLSPDYDWSAQEITKREYPYTIDEYGRMEEAMFSTFPFNGGRRGICSASDSNRVYPETKGYEEYLFSGMCAALDVLKSIHKEHGQIISEDIPLTKRKLEAVK